jgi:hypothetical protein
MSEELNAGVNIFLERCKSNPDEILEDYGKWDGLVNAVFSYVEEGRRQPLLRGLTDEEIRLMFKTLNNMYRDKFAARIMGHVLRNDGEEETVKPKTLKMTGAQVSIAKKLGISPRQYAAALLKESE